ncbi:ly6/PLAUR domain-containing protein 2-like [Pelodytes ibericus]
MGLMCFTCNTPTPSEDCATETNCTELSPHFIYCKTSVYSSGVAFPFSGSEMVVRQCSQNCRPTNQNSLGVSNPVFCCNIDFCNRNGIDNGSEDETCNGGPDTLKLHSMIMAICLLTVTGIILKGL